MMMICIPSPPALALVFRNISLSCREPAGRLGTTAGGGYFETER
jgi:hypothetical protein